MQSVSQKVSSLGQPSKAVSFTRQTTTNWDGAVALVTAVEGGAAQSPDTTAVTQRQDEKAANPLRERISVAPQLSWSLAPSLRAKQLWEGTVLSCSHHGFTARLKDCTNPANPDEVADFDLEEIRHDDLELVAPGAAFYWTLGTEQSQAGQVTNVMRVNFRRLPAWNKAALESATNSAEDVLSLFTGDVDDDSDGWVPVEPGQPIFGKHAKAKGAAG